MVGVCVTSSKKSNTIADYVEKRDFYCMNGYKERIEEEEKHNQKKTKNLLKFDNIKIGWRNLILNVEKK